MSALAAVLFIYAVISTVLLITAGNSRDKYIRRSQDLERRVQYLQSLLAEKEKREGASTTPQAQPQVQPQVQAQPQNLAPQYVYTPAKPAAAPVQQAAPQIPTYTPAAAPAKKGQGLGAVGVSFAVGVLLMVIAAAVFISATWQTMPAGGKCGVLALVVAVVYGLCAFCKSKLKLAKTSSVLYMLGSLITPLAIMVGFFAFESKETALMLSCCGLALGITGYLGYRIFKSTYQVGISYFGFVWMEIFLCMKIIGNFEGFTFGLCFAALVSGIIHYVWPKLKYFGIFAEVTAYCAVIGFFMACGIRSEMMAWSIISQVIYFVSLLLLNRRRGFIKYLSALCPLVTMITLLLGSYVTDRTVYAVIYVILVPVLFALYKLLKQANFASNLFISAGLAVLMLLVGKFGDDVTDFCHYASLIGPILAYAAVIFMSKNKIERPFYWYFSALALLIFICDVLDGAAPAYIFLAVFAVAVLAAWKFKNVHLPIAGASAFVIAYIASTDWNNDLAAYAIITGIIVFAMYGAVVIINRIKPLTGALYNAVKFSLLPMLIITNFYLTVGVFEDCAGTFVTLIILDIAFVAVTLFDKDNYFSVLPAISFMIVVIDKLTELEMEPFLIGTIFVAGFVAVGRIFICEKIIRKGRIDYLTMLAGFACFIPAEKFYMTTFLMTIYILSFIGRFSNADSVEERIKSNIRIILSAALGMLAVTFAITDVTYGEYTDFEVRMLFLLAAAFVIFMFIKPGPAARWIWFSTVAFTIECEACRAMGNGYLMALTFVSVCVCGIFIYSFIAKKRSWFILSISNIALIGIMFAITFWDSKLWWIYLLVLGAILIGTASVNEYKRRRAIEAGLQDKKIRLFDSWTW